MSELKSSTAGDASSEEAAPSVVEGETTASTASTQVQSNSKNKAPHKSRSSISERAAQHVRQSAEKAAAITKKAGSNLVHEAEHASELAVNGTRFTLKCIGMCIWNIPTKWPRCYSFVFGVVLPLWLLVAFSGLFGYMLSYYESSNEIAGNDAILETRANILLEVYLDRNETESDDGATRRDLMWDDGMDFHRRLLPDHRVLLADQIPADLLNAYHFRSTANRRKLQQSSFDQSVIANLDADYLVFQNFVEDLDVPFLADLLDAFETLSFNWVRCWNDTVVDLSRVYIPTRRQMQAARPSNQTEFFVASWVQDHEEKYNAIISKIPNATDAEKASAFLVASSEATGGEGCEENVEGTTWFWFTIMTTVGYGNQAPTTVAGRTLVWTAGFFSLLLFGAVLGFGGYIIGAIFDDFMNRVHLGFVTWPWVGCVLWGTLWFLWMLLIGHSADEFWTSRLADPDYATRADTLWFAYISTSTIGLGDFFINPEVTFWIDVLNFSFQFLVGFILLSAFLGKFGELLSSLMPHLGSRLPVYLRNSSPWRLRRQDFGIHLNPQRNTILKQKEMEMKEEARLKAMQNLVDEHPKIDRNLDSLDKEEALLKEMLELTALRRNEVVQADIPKDEPKQEVVPIPDLEQSTSGQGISNDHDDSISRGEADTDTNALAIEASEQGVGSASDMSNQGDVLESQVAASVAEELASGLLGDLDGMFGVENYNEKNTQKP